MPIQRSRAELIGLTVGVAILILALDLLTPHGIAVWLLYLVPLLLASEIIKSRGIWFVTGVLTALIWIGLLLSTPRNALMPEVINASLAVMTMWVTAYFLIRRLHAERQVEADRAQLHQNLANERTRWEATVESMLDPVAVCDAEGRATYMNSAYSRMIGRGIESGLRLDDHPVHYQLYRPDGSLFAPQDLPLQQAALQGREVRGVEVIQRAADGTEHVALWNAAPLRDSSGRITGAVATGREVTAQRRAEAALRRSEEAYRTLAENAPDAIDRFDRTCARIYANQKSARLYSASADALVGKRIEETGLPEVCTSRWKEKIRQVFETGQLAEIEDELPTVQGTRAFHSRFAPEPAADGSVASVVVFSHDVTERKRAEEDLRASEEKLRLALGAAGAGLWEWNIRTNENTWSDEYYRIAGLLPEETQASYDAWLQSVHPEDREGVLRAIEGAIQEHIDLDVEFRIVRPDGSVRWLNERGKTFYDVEHRPIRMLGISMDITEHKQADEALRSARDVLWRQLCERTDALAQIGEQLEVDAVRFDAGGKGLGELSEQLKRRVSELATLDKVSRELVASLESEQVLRVLVNEVRGLLCAEGASVLLYHPEEDALSFAAVAGLGSDTLTGERLAASSGLGGWILREKRPILVPDVRNHPLVTDSPEVLLDGAVRSILAVPLLSKGTAIGILGAVNKIGSAFDEADMRSLMAVASVAAVAIENARLFKSEQERRSQLEAVRAVATEIAREMDLPKLLHLIARRAGDLLGAATGTVWLWHEKAQVLAPGVSLGHDWWTEGRRLRLGEGVAGTVARRREGLVVNDYAASPYALPVVTAQSRISAVLAEPLLYHDRLVGVIALDNESTGRTFTKEDQQLLALFAAHAAIAIGNAGLYHELRVHRDRLRSLTVETLKSREEEAKRIARELHDEIGQSLTCILLGLQGVEKLASVEEMRKKSTELRALVAKPLGDVQRLIKALRPILLDELGLIPALERYVKGFAAATGLHVEFYAHGLEGTRLPSAVEINLYRTLQESLSNVAKHARARNVSVLVKRGGKVVSLIVEDDGQGFDVAAVKARRGDGSGVGLMGMEERAFLLSGSVTIESSPGKGTTIVSEVPIEEPGTVHGTN